MSKAPDAAGPAVVAGREPHRVGPRDGRLEQAPELPPAFEVLVRQRVLVPAEVEIVQHEAEGTGRVAVVHGHRVHHEVHVVPGRAPGRPGDRDVGFEIAADVELDRPEPGVQQLVHHRLAVLRGVDGRRARAAPEAVAPPAEHVRDGEVLVAGGEVPERDIDDSDDREGQADAESAPERGEDARPIERIGAREERRGGFLDGGHHRPYRKLGRPGESRSLLALVSLQGQEHRLHVHGPSASPSEVAAEVVGFNRHVGDLHGRSPLWPAVRRRDRSPGLPVSRAWPVRLAAEAPTHERAAILVPRQGERAS